jgi:hypothetical protein
VPGLYLEDFLTWVGTEGTSPAALLVAPVRLHPLPQPLTLGDGRFPIVSDLRRLLSLSHVP